MCFFKNITQFQTNDASVLGHYHSVEKQNETVTVLKFTEGNFCVSHNKTRGARVSLVCGEEAYFVEMSEP